MLEVYGSKEIYKVITVHPEGDIGEDLSTTSHDNSSSLVPHKTTNVNLHGDARRQVIKVKGTNHLCNMYVCTRFYSNPSSNCDMSVCTKLVNYQTWSYIGFSPIGQKLTGIYWSNLNEFKSFEYSYAKSLSASTSCKN